MHVVKMVSACASDVSEWLDGVFRGPLWYLFLSHTTLCDLSVCCKA